MAVCRTCAAVLPDGARYCPACGAAVAARGGEERKVVTVLFADLVQSTAQADRRDPEEVRAAVRPQLVRIREELERHGGTFEKYVGDAVMAVFGAPLAHEDDPERAVRAALAIRDAIEGVRVAVNTGEAVVTLAAAPGAGEGIATGDVVNTAFRIEEAAGDDTVLVGEPTYRATQSAIEYGERRLIRAKGKAESVPVYEALQVASELHPSPSAPLAPLVGRHHELSLVIDTLARAKRDRTVQLVTLVGVPGIGKSRLVWELQRALEAEPGLVTWRRGRCLPYGDGVTFWALGEMVKAQARILLSDDAATALAKLRRSVRDLVADPAEAEWVEGHLRPLLALEAATPGGRRDEAFAAWRRLFEALADWGPLVLVFEDLHWADEGLLDFIEHLADWGTGMPLVLLCTARPGLHERRAGWGGRPNAATISLPPLSQEETGQLVGFLLKQPLVPAELQQAMVARAEGNPLYAEEFVRMLVERGFLYRDGGGWQLTAGDLPVPESVQGIIAARLDGLPPEEKEVLRDAAVVGRRFWPGAVSAVSGVDQGTIEGLLRALERKELVRRVAASAIAGELQYSFHHALVRDGAYGLIPRAERASKHRLAAAWAENLGRPEDHSETIAHHYLQAIDYARGAGQDTGAFADRARTALRDAGDRALALNSFAPAERFYTAALELWPQEAPGRAELLFLLGLARFRSTGSGGPTLEEAAATLLVQGDTARAAEAEVMIGEEVWMQGRREEGFAHLERAEQLLADASPSRSKAYVLCSLARFLRNDGRDVEAIRVGLAALKLAEQLDAADLCSNALNTIGVARSESGDLGGVDDLERSLSLAQQANSPEAVRAYLNLGSILARLGDLPRAFELHAYGRRAAEHFGDLGWIRWLAAERVYEQYWSGRLDDALESADEILAEVESGAPHRMELAARLIRGWIRLARGDVSGAVEDAERGLAFARGAGDPQALFPALAFAARAALAEGRRQAASDLVDQLLESWEQWSLALPSTGMADLGLVCRGLGRADDLERVAVQKTQTRWLEAALAVARGDFARGADLYAAIGSVPDEQLTRDAEVVPSARRGRPARAD